MPKIAVLTSGGDSPGMNYAVTSIARSAAYYGLTLIGIKRGYNGLLGLSDGPEDDIYEMNLDTVLDLADLPGTYLRTARCDKFLEPEYREEAARCLRELDLLGLIVIGGDGSFHGAQELCRLGISCIGIPGTIDNDLPYTEMTLGYDSVVNCDIGIVRAIRATSRSHDRPAVVEVMGRHCGDIALSTAEATGSEIVLVPEVAWSVDEVAARLNRLIAQGNTRATIVVAEGAYESMKPFDVYGFLKPYGKEVYEGQKMNADLLASTLKRLTHAEVRSTVIGYTQRGCLPTARDCTFAFEAGNMAVTLLKNGIGNEVIGVRNNRTFHTSIDTALCETRYFKESLYNLINSL